MDFNRIETAPKNEDLIVLQDERAALFEIARWSVEKRKWLRENGDSIQIMPTHWAQLPGVEKIGDNSHGYEATAVPARRGSSLYTGLLMIAGFAILIVSLTLGNFSGKKQIDTLVSGEGRPLNATESKLQNRDVKGGPPANSQATATSSHPPSYLDADSTNPRLERTGSANGASVATQPTSGNLADLRGVETRVGDATATGQMPLEEEPAIEQERRTADVLASNLIGARNEIEALKARVAAATAAHAEVTQALQVTQASASEQKQRLDNERQRVETLSLDLTAAREEIDACATRVLATTAAHSESAQALRAAEASAAQQNGTLKRERERSDALARDLASAQAEMEALKTPVAVATAAPPLAMHREHAPERWPQSADGFVHLVRVLPIQPATHAGANTPPVATSPIPTPPSRPTGLAPRTSQRVTSRPAGASTTGNGASSPVEQRGNTAAPPGRKPSSAPTTRSRLEPRPAPSADPLFGETR